MASLMSELERFEQEMKELGSETSQLLTPPPPSHVTVGGHLPAPLPPQTPPPHSSRLKLNTTPTTPFLVPPPPLPHILSVETFVAKPQLPPHRAWVNDSATSTSPIFIYARPTLSKPLIPSIISAPKYSYSATSAATTYTPVPPTPPPLARSSYFQIPFHLQQQCQLPLQQYNPTLQTIYQDQTPTHLTTSQSTIVPTNQYQYLRLYQQSATTRLEPTIYPVPQQRQAQQLFQRDAQTITLEALQSVKVALASGKGEQKIETKKKAIPRKAAGQTWEDPTLAEWPETLFTEFNERFVLQQKDDHRLFCGDLGNEVNDEVLTKAFLRFISFNKARVVRDKRTGKTKGYGFVSFANPTDLDLAFKEMNGKYVGNRPIKLRKSTWKERIDTGFVQNLKHNKHNKQRKTSKRNILHK